MTESSLRQSVVPAVGRCQKSAILLSIRANNNSYVTKAMLRA